MQPMLIEGQLILILKRFHSKMCSDPFEVATNSNCLFYKMLFTKDLSQSLSVQSREDEE